MELKDSYFIKRDGNYIWLAQGVEPKPNDEIVEVRKMLCAKDGYTLQKDGVDVGSVVWLQGDDSIGNYTEVEMPPIVIDEEEDG